MTPVSQETQHQSKKQGVKDESKTVQKKAQETSSAAPPDSRSAELLIGIPGSRDGVKKIQRNVPADEPPQLPPNSELKVIGNRVPRYDGALKVSGAAKYPSDIRLPGMLYARFVNATVPHAKIISVDTSAAEKHPGVKAVHVLQDVLGQAELQDKAKEVPSRYPIVRYAGQPIAAVAATTPAGALEAARLVKVQYEPKPFVVERAKAREPNAPLVFPGPAAEKATAGGGGGASDVPQKGNVRGPNRGRHDAGPKGDIEKGFAGPKDSRGRQVYPNALRFGDPRPCGRLEAGWLNCLRLHPRHNERARRTGRDLQLAQDEGSRLYGIHGRRLWREVRREQSRSSRSALVKESRRSRTHVL